MAKSLLEQINKDREPMKVDKVEAMLHPEKVVQAEGQARKDTEKKKNAQGKPKQGQKKKAQEKAKQEQKKEYTIQPRQREARSRRLQLLLTPSLYGKVERKAKQLGISVNELINTVLDDVIGE